MAMVVIHLPQPEIILMVLQTLAKRFSKHTHMALQEMLQPLSLLPIILEQKILMATVG